jgi:hypothetical protein
LLDILLNFSVLPLVLLDELFGVDHDHVVLDEIATFCHAMIGKSVVQT